MIKSIVRIPLILLSILFALALMIGSTTSWVAPSTSMIPTYLGLAYPGLVAANVLMLLVWLFHFKKYVFIPIVALGVCHSDVTRTFTFHSSDESGLEGGKKLKVLTYNMFISNVHQKNLECLNYIAKQDADIVCLQEIGYIDDAKKMTLDDLKKILTKAYPYYYLDLSPADYQHCGVAVFSKYKILESKNLDIKAVRPSAAFVKLDVDGQKVRVACLHLQSNHLTAQDKSEIEALKTAKKEERKNTIKNIEMKLSDAYVCREKEADIIAEELAKTDEPTIICGDFNDVPVSYAAHTIRGGVYRDVFSEVGSGYCNTYHENKFFFRIDHMFHSDHFLPLTYAVDTVTYSDHYPVQATLTLKK